MPFFVGAIHETTNACCQEEPSLLCPMVARSRGMVVQSITAPHGRQMTRLRIRTVSMPSSGPARRWTTCSTTSCTLRGRNPSRSKWMRHRIRQLVVYTHYIYGIVHTHTTHTTHTRICIHAHRIIHIVIVIQSFTKRIAYRTAYTTYCTHKHKHNVSLIRNSNGTMMLNINLYNYFRFSIEFLMYVSPYPLLANALPRSVTF